MPDPIHCLCGDTPEVQPSSHRTKAREQWGDRFKSLDAMPHDSGPEGREYERIKLALQVIAPDHTEVSCPSCGRWVHAPSDEAAINTWNKAVDKLAQLQACCLSDYERREDYDGQIMHVCTSPDHDDSIHGRRYLPLEPSSDYAPDPRDAGRA